FFREPQKSFAHLSVGAIVGETAASPRLLQQIKRPRHRIHSRPRRESHWASPSRRRLRFVAGRCAHGSRLMSGTRLNIVQSRPGLRGLGLTAASPISRSCYVGAGDMAFRPRELADRMARRRKPDDGYVRETFTLPRDKARSQARDFLNRYPKAAYMSGV